jgi:hypothetical protein
VTGKYKMINRQLGSFEVLFSRPAEVSVAMGEWATVNFCPCDYDYEHYFNNLIYRIVFTISLTVEIIK